MPLDALPTSPTTDIQAPEATPDRRVSPGERCVAAIADAASALNAHLAAPADGAAWTRCNGALHRAALAVADLTRANGDPSLQDALPDLIRSVIAAGVHERLAAEALGRVPDAKGWPGVAALMLVRPAWSAPSLPDVGRMPEWLVDTCAQWLFAVPQRFVGASQSDAYAAYSERLLSDLASWVERNPGASTVRLALEHYQARSNRHCLRVSSHDLRHHAELHSRIVARLARLKAGGNAPVAMSREGRRLRVGYVVPEFDGGAEMRATMPLLCHLDPDRFETEIFVLRSTETRWETAARQMAVQVQTLPEEFAEQASMIGNAMLDVLVFCGEVAGTDGALAQLATLRMAPLQAVAAAHQPTSTGSANVDLFVTGDLTLLSDQAAQFTERLGVMRGPARVLDFVTGGSAEGTTAIGRADARIPTDAMVFVAAADWAQITGETRTQWARLLAAVPNSYLLLQRVGTEAVDDAAVARHCAELDQVLAQAEVADNRSIVLSVSPASQTELEAVLALGDVYLDMPTVGDDVAALAALVRGVPVVTVAGPTLRQRRVAALLRSIGCDELVASTAGDFESAVLRLVKNPTERGALAERIQNTMAAGPWPFDALAAGDAFGDLLETAFDELAAAGPSGFRRNRAPLQVSERAASADEHVRAAAAALADFDSFGAAEAARKALQANPRRTDARILLGRALLAAGQTARSVDYLLAAVEAPEADAECWFSLAQALHQNGQSREAVQALQTCLQLEPARAESWLMLIELAEGAGMLDLAREALQQLKLHAPEHPAIAAAGSRLGD